jgi:hypothetical protein
MLLTEKLTIYTNVIFIRLVIQQFSFYNIFVILLYMFITLLHINLFMNICVAKKRKRLFDKKRKNCIQTAMLLFLLMSSFATFISYSFSLSLKLNDFCFFVAILS